MSNSDDPQGHGDENKPVPSVNQSRLKALIGDAQSEVAINKCRLAADREMTKTFAKLGPKYGWVFATFVTDYWPLKLKPVSLDSNKTEWDLFLDRERKRVKAAPRKNACVEGMTADEAKRHRTEQNRSAKQAERARRAAAASAALDSGHPLTDDQLEVIRLAEAEQPTLTGDLELLGLLAQLKAAEARGR